MELATKIQRQDELRQQSREKVELSYIKGIVSQNIPFLISDVDDKLKLFQTDVGKNIQSFLKKYFKENGSFPSLELIHAATGENLKSFEATTDDVVTLKSFLLEEAKRDYLHKNILNLVNLYMKGDTSEQIGTKLSNVASDYLLLDSDKSNNQLAEIGPDLNSVYEAYLEKKKGGGPDGVPLPWPTLTERTQGLHPGELFIIIGLLGVGKTWASLHMATEAWARGKRRVLFASFEMSTDAMLRRAAALIAKLPYRALRTGNLNYFQEEKFQNAIKDLSDIGGYHIIGNGALHSMDDLQLYISHFKPEIVFVDAFYKIDAGGSKKSMWENVSESIWALKKCSGMYNVPVVATTQFNREAVRKKSKEGGLGEIGMSFAIAQDADCMMALTPREAADGQEPVSMKLKLLKLREDAPGSPIEISWDLENMNFEELASEDPVIEGIDSITSADDITIDY